MLKFISCLWVHSLAAVVTVLTWFGHCAGAGIPCKLELPEATLTDSTRLVQYEAFTLMYNLNTLNPQWVAWELEARETEGDVGRCSKFSVDCSLDFIQADNDDYRNSGYDRGHMAPAADMKWSETAMRESFYYTNACPQNHNLNAGVWKSLEEKCRALANVYGRVWIACGPIFDAHSQGYIGQHNVAVPDAFYKVMLVRSGGKYEGIGFICDNKAGKKPLEYYVWTVDEVEEITGLNFFESLDDEDEATAESSVNLDVWF